MFLHHPPLLPWLRYGVLAWLFVCFSVFNLTYATMDENNQPQDDTHTFRCVPCNLSIVGLPNFLRHHRTVRVRHAPPIQCGECDLSYEHFTSLTRHIKSVHYRQIAVRYEQPAGRDEAAPQDDDQHPGQDDIEGMEANVEGEPDSNSDYSDGEMNMPIDLTKSAAKMVLNLRQTGAITSSTIERCQEECFQMMQEVGASIRQDVKKFLISQNINTPASRAFLKSITVEDPFQRIKTLKQQLNYFSKELGLVKPVTQFLDYRIDYRLNSKSGQREPVNVPMSFEYIPVIETLTMAVKNAKVRSLIEAEEASADGVFRSYLDGRRCKENPLIVRFPRIIRIQIYWDDVEVVNPLGSKTIIHKIAAFYFSIQNLPGVESSQLSSIYLLALAYSEDLKGPGRFEKILSPFMRDLRKLESDEGVIIQIEGAPFCLRATLTVLCADSLAAHEILGFLSPAGARCFCRKCMVTRAQFRAHMNIVAERRTKATFEGHARLAAISRRNATATGVSRGCPLHLSKAFDATKDCVFDIFHDLLEGVAHWVISLALRSYILEHKYFTVEQFNGRITAFNYGVPDIKNKPSANLTDKSLLGNKLKQTGSQMWCLTRAFGFLVADVPEDDVNLKLVNLLQSIMLIVFAEEIRPDDITNLENLIEEHHRLFQELHVINGANVIDEDDEDDDEEENDGNADENEPPGNLEDNEMREDEAEAEVDDPAGNGDNEENAEGQNVGRDARVIYREVKIHARNKLHHMTHLPEEIRDHGNLVRYWCARYEARHQIFSRYGSVCCNFINIVKSMAQMYQISTLSGLLKTSFRSEEIDLQNSLEMSVTSSNHRNLLIGAGMNPTAIVKAVDAVVIAGEAYRPGLFVITDAATPTFSLIDFLYVFNNMVYLVVMPWKTVMFRKRYCAYQVKTDPDAEPILLRHDALARHGAFGPWNPWNRRTVHVAPRTIFF